MSLPVHRVILGLVFRANHTLIPALLDLDRRCFEGIFFGTLVLQKICSSLNRKLSRDKSNKLSKISIYQMKLHYFLTLVLFLISLCTSVAFGFVAVSPLSTIPGSRKATNCYSEPPVKGMLFTSPFLRSEIRGQSALSYSCDEMQPIANSNFPKRGAFGLMMRSFPGRKIQEKKRQLAQTHHALSKV